MPSTVAEVEAALFAMNDDQNLPFAFSREGDRLVATDVYVDAKSGLNSLKDTYRLKITLLPATAEYKASSVTHTNSANGPGGLSYKYKFSTFSVTRPVYAKLAELGWTKKKSWIGSLFGGGGK